AFVLVPYLGAQSYVPLTAAALGGSLLGFLPYNYQPARIYMGDSGALFLGFLVRLLTLKQALVLLLFSFLGVMPFTIFVSMIRMDEGFERIKENPFKIFLGPGVNKKPARKI